MPHAIGSQVEIEEIQAADDTESGYPVKGVHVGGGRHAAMTDDPASPGWTRHAQVVRKHPSNGKYAYPVGPELAAKLAGKVPAHALEKILAAGPLPPSWDPPDNIPAAAKVT